jgi:hypothetical protein
MKYKPKKRRTYKQYSIAQQENRDTFSANRWLAACGIGPEYLHIGIPEVFIAMKLARKAIDDHACLLRFDKLDFLKKFVSDVSYVKRRQKIKQSRCFKVMNIYKQVIRKAAQQR